MEEEEQQWIEDRSDDEEDNEQPLGFDLFNTDKKDPVDEFKIEIGDETITLHGIRSRYPHLLQSTGMTLWKGSKNLCNYLCENPSVVCGKTIVELGAGMGLCGMIAYKKGASKVVLTDGDTDTLRNMRSNISSNVDEKAIAKEDIICKQLLWGKNVESFRSKWTNDGFDIVMGGDIAYAQSSLQILFETATGLLSNASTACFILSFCFRGGVSVGDIEEACHEFNLDFKKIGEGEKEAIYLIRRRRRL